MTKEREPPTKFIKLEIIAWEFWGVGGQLRKWRVQRTTQLGLRDVRHFCKMSGKLRQQRTLNPNSMEQLQGPRLGAWGKFVIYDTRWVHGSKIPLMAACRRKYPEPSTLDPITSH